MTNRIFEVDKQELPIDFTINSLILEQASDIAEELTKLECLVNGIETFIIDDETTMFTDEAQDIFNVYYDEQVTKLYDLFNLQLEFINNAA